MICGGVIIVVMSVILLVVVIVLHHTICSVAFVRNEFVGRVSVVELFRAVDELVFSW